ncbi:MAG: GNAT family N-acetyltransferase [Anaerolineales bacterium]|nr:GNAT family N-acetyltransferase [Anaerolineales bacterium]
MIGHPGRGEFSLRPARAGDQASIRRLVRQGRINPSGLDWRRFVVAVDGEQRVIGCGQIKPHRGHAPELASIVVDPHWRGGGVASAIIHSLMQAGPPLWLVCRSRLAPFYARFGFRALSPRDPAPAHFRRLLRLGRWLNPLSPANSRLSVMVWKG